jgi:hypothetical protein
MGGVRGFHMHQVLSHLHKSVCHLTMYSYDLLSTQSLKSCRGWMRNSSHSVMTTWVECNHPWGRTKSEEIIGEDVNLSRKKSNFGR